MSVMLVFQDFPPIVLTPHLPVERATAYCPHMPTKSAAKLPRKLSPIAKLESRDQEEKPAGSQSAKTSPRSWWKGIPCNSRTQQHLIRRRRNSPLDSKIKQGASFPIRSLSAHSNVRLHSPPLGLSGSEDTAKGPSGYWEQRS